MWLWCVYSEGSRLSPVPELSTERCGMVWQLGLQRGSLAAVEVFGVARDGGANYKLRLPAHLACMQLLVVLVSN